MTEGYYFQVLLFVCSHQLEGIILYQVLQIEVVFQSFSVFH